MGPDPLSRYRAERLLRKDFVAQRAKVLAVVRAQLRGKGVRLDGGDLEACYAQAWHGLYATVLAGEAVENPSAWLVLVTFRRAIDEARAASRAGVGTLAEEAVGIDDRAGDSSRDIAKELDDRARLRQVFEGLRSTLSKRECEAASLCYLQGLTRAEAADQMGISAARMGKLMEGAGAGRPGVASKVGSLLDTIRVGGWCEQQSSLMRAYAFGILDPEGERHALAAAHCRECPACRAHVASLRGLASVLPLPFISPHALAGGPGAARDAPRAGWRRRVAAHRPRAPRGSSHGWGGIGGPLTAKLAVSALVVLGCGYALLGSRAHRSPTTTTARATATTPGARTPTSSVKTLLAAFGAPAGRGQATRPLPASKSRSSHARGSRSVGRASSREFLPERVSHEQAALAPATTPAPARTPGGSAGGEGEFGIE